MCFEVFDVPSDDQNSDDKARDRPQLCDLANIARVSLATVDRVINRRKGVKERTRKRVLDVARDIGFLSSVEVEGYGRERLLHIVVLLPAGTNPYLHLLGERVKDRVGRSGVHEPILRCYFIDGFNADAQASALRTYAA
jgi:LacI family transcriptional regulator